MLDENYKVGTKHEEEIPRIMKMLGYPFLISKSSMFTIGTPHTWPTMLAGLSYVVDLINVSTHTHLDFGPRSKKTCLPGFVNNNGADQTCSQAFVINSLERIISKFATSKISLF